MTRRRRTLLASLLASALVLGFWLLHQKPEPAYQGKKLSIWFAEFRQVRIGYVQRTSLGDIQVPVRNFAMPADCSAALQSPAGKALAAIGTNSLPYLEEQLKGESWWTRNYATAYKRLPGLMQKIAPSPAKPRVEVQLDAALACAALQTNAAHAVPKLLEIYKQRRASPWTDERLKLALLWVPWKPEAFDAILKAFPIDASTDTVHTFQLRSVVAARTLTNALLSPMYFGGPNLPSRAVLADDLCEFTNYLEIVLPALNAVLASGTGTHGLKLTPQDQYVRFVAARSLEFFGTNALTCLPTVIAATHDSEPMVQNVALRIMEKVQRDAPSKK